MTPTFKFLGGAKINDTTSNLELKFVATDDKVYTFELEPSCGPMLLMQVTGLLGQLLPKLPLGKTIALQPIVLRSFQAAMADTGKVALVLTGENGVEFPLEFPASGLRELAETLSELATLADPTARH